MTIETDPGNNKKSEEDITREDLDLIGSDGNKEGSGGYDDSNLKLGPDDGDMLG